MVDYFGVFVNRTVRGTVPAQNIVLVSVVAMFILPLGTFAVVDNLSPIHQFLHVHCGIRMVCLVTRQKILYAPVQFICMDSHRFANCGRSVLPHHSKHFRRNDLVSWS